MITATASTRMPMVQMYRLSDGRVVWVQPESRIASTFGVFARPMALPMMRQKMRRHMRQMGLSLL